MGKALENREEVEVLSRDDLRDWLSKHHGRATGVWLVHHKKASEHYLPMADIVAECLAFGWVDSLSRGKDDLRTMHWIAPRTPGSNWSAINKRVVETLTAEGRMTDAGRKAVAAAKDDGSWTALDGVERLEVPEDLAAAFDAHPGAASKWEGLPRSARRAVLEWILNAKRPATRAARIDATAREAAQGRAANQWRER